MIGAFIGVGVGDVQLRFNAAQEVTGNDLLNLPINCVLIGDQPEPGDTDSDLIRKMIFGE